MSFMRNNKFTKDVNKSIKAICYVYIRICESSDRDERLELKSISDMARYISNPNFVFELTHTYPSEWHKLLDAICGLLSINKTFTNYDMLKKAIYRLRKYPEYAIDIKDRGLSENTPHYIIET